MMQNTCQKWTWIATLLIGLTSAACGGSTSPEPGGADPAVPGPAAGAGGAASAQDRAAVVERLRAELALLLKQDPAQLPIDRPVTALGADDLTVVEWQMAAERTFRVDIANDALFDPESKAARKDLTITSMAEVVGNAPQWPPGRTR
jgi:hypothetical protein